MRKFSTVGALAIAVAGSSMIAAHSDAAVLRYRASGDWSSITDGATPGWGPNPAGVGTSLPGASDDARINFGGNIVTISTSVPAVNRVQIGVDESGTVDVVNGGVLTANLDILAGNNNSNATGTLNVNNGGTVNVGRILWSGSDNSNGVININNGGTVNVDSHLWWGVTGSTTATINGFLNQTGGILGLGTDNASTATGGTALVTVGDGGLLSLSNISGSLNSIQAGSSITITGTGELTLPGDFVDVLNDYVSNNLLLGDGLVIDLTKNPGFTTAYLPEPGSFLLIGMGAAGVLARHRRI